MELSGRVGLGAALFVSSAAGLILEIVAARLIAPYVGMSVYTWTAIIATVLAGMSVGHWIGGRLAEKSDDKALGIVALAFALAALNVLAVPLLLRWTAPALFAGEGHILATVTLLSAVLFLLPSIFVALPSPILTRLAIDAEPERRGPVIGRMFALGAGGAILGTLAAGFVFISWIGSNGTLIAVAAVLGLLAAGFALWARRVRTAQSALGLVICALALAGFGGERILTSACDAESRYYCIRIVDVSAETGTETRLMVLDHMGHGFNDRADPALLHAPYVDLMDRLVALKFDGRRDLRTFFIGGGAYTLPRAWAAEYPDGRHIVAEIDPRVTEMAEAHMWFRPGPAVDIRHADARVALKSVADGSLDVVVGDAFHDISVPQHLVTREFAAEIAAKLAPGGSYVMNVIDAASEPSFMLAMLKTLRDVFPVVEIWADTEQLAAGGRMTYLLAAHGKAFRARALVSDDFPGRRWVRVDPARIAGSVKPSDLPVLSDDFAPVDRLIGAVQAEAR